jgi:nitroreductase
VSSGTSFSRAELLALVSEARRAPSVHNIQPARWAQAKAGMLLLTADPARTLPIADPSGHDVRVSLGAAWEGMAIALSSRGYEVGPPELDFAHGVAGLRLTPGGTTDPLAREVPRRATHRGAFRPTPAAALDALSQRVSRSGAVVIRDRAAIHDLARLADDATGEFLLDPRYWRETWQWLRLRPAHPDWDRDGLNADALALSGIERTLGRGLMAPAGFEWMRRLGLVRALVSERAKTESAGALLLFTAPVDEDPLETGRAFYRRWLEVTAMGLALCPMSVLADSPRANVEIRRRFALPEARRLVNVLRVGAAPAGFPARLTPRLPPEELLVEPS